MISRRFQFARMCANRIGFSKYINDFAIRIAQCAIAFAQPFIFNDLTLREYVARMPILLQSIVPITIHPCARRPYRLGLRGARAAHGEFSEVK